MPDYVKVAQLSELVERELKAVKIGRDDVAVVLVDGTLYAFEDNCPHASCSITPGLAEGDEVYCMCQPLGVDSSVRSFRMYRRSK